MEKFGKSQPVKRVEDIRFLTGEGRYVDDVAPESALRAFVFRSPVAHATITDLDVSDARDAPGVHMVVTAQDLADAGITYGLKTTPVTNTDGSTGAYPRRPVLAEGKLNFVGEPVALVVADTLEQAKDAAELIVLDYDDLPAQLALAPGDTAIHAEAPDNRAFDWSIGDKAATDAAFAKAARVVTLDVADNRIIVNAMEPRGCHANWDGQRLHIAFGGQGVWGPKAEFVDCFGLAPEDVQVTIPDVGGGFGMKAFVYPEYFSVAFAARELGQPVRWIAERTESMLSDNGGRDLTHTASLAFDADNRITAYTLHSICNMGAYNSTFAQQIQTNLFARVLMGVYDVQTTFARVEGFFTNTTPVDAYRGAGRPEAIYLLERVIDRAARELGVDGWELRHKNFIPVANFPYKTATGELYDVGDFSRILNNAAALSDTAGLEARKADSAARGMLRGQGLCYYIESILGQPFEDVKVEFPEEGGALIYVGTQSNGQGHETVFAQFLADQTGIPADQITVVQGDSDRIARGGGTGGSRSVTNQTNVTLKAVASIVTAFSAFLAEELGIDPGQVSFDDETFRAEGSNMTPTMLEVARMARDKGRDDLLSFSETAELPGRSYPNGAHVAEVEIDPETGVVRLDRYSVVDDFGNLINPMLALGQVHGGVAQGIGQALCEQVSYDEDGQLLSATFMDYAMPRADQIPMMTCTFAPVPSTANPMGMKGCGEAGTVGALAAVANAVQDALWERGVRQADMPFTPHRVWAMLQDEAIAAE
ncbi:xanthine dehydrogenase family protein molybdopterin-binding subunit [Mesobacterium sp. TK19101]|uniref:Xanthine dehydrogenase family protein molybdopterin-binding subunit n=1 Tax=Mesobacterium hydrothermale TaxID=3111907 RepID=A0ABU6HL51_9RHOB|nr:xanthine dehydrogenase family protein molybdopterin-binding subunit [Mesobacterium sp. TK19101]MEC3863189.1 xanthine dehydrogenase family protein molybdopterin-binding subunit [Mesobacterium sp. TK19101]